MGALNAAALVGKRIYLGANIFIYAVEGHADFRARVEEVFALFDDAKAEAVSSELTLAECLAKPLADNDSGRQQVFENAISSRPGLLVAPITRGVLVAAARIRSQSKVRLPDAIHLATAHEHQCELFLTNDKLVKPQAGFTVVQLSQA